MIPRTVHTDPVPTGKRPRWLREGYNDSTERVRFAPGELAEVTREAIRRGVNSRDFLVDCALEVARRGGGGAP